ncbi:hypothetical protein CAPTEDRAFT_129894 [Capitella teleta]|uniref:ubiquitinyl hydrolase 1 n=1 Tax=Capitella teleta TaxID=283909 RepID=R7TZE2_CAPTE|nr:hypothetical protein CAPTEDRAFT_129894 [Capitella teleta]|eukprot:ELT99007.1 hypothetical protein CAPTEDRAFT_129894 [Capitella teleta]
MGGKESKLSYISYEDACRRVTDAELQRLRDAFKRSSTLSNHMTCNLFTREVLGDGVPPRLAELIFQAFGGSPKGLTFKELLCGLVLITRGSQEERVRFLFGLFSNESYIQKDEMDTAVLSLEGQVPQAMSELFLESDRVTYECFRHWVLSNADATNITKWLLKEPSSVTISNDLETPTFFQTLSGVTHLEEKEITDLERRYWNFKTPSKTGQFDLEILKSIVCPPLPELLVNGLFAAFDVNRDNHIDFKEMACGISACCRGPMLERQKFCFKIFDADQDNLLSRAELEDMIAIMMVVRKENSSPDQLVNDLTPERLAEQILKSHDADGDDMITQEEYLVWTVSHALPAIFLDLLFQVCHTVLGLKPPTKEEERHVIMSYLEREDRYGLQLSQIWYLISMSWWRQWLDYVGVMVRPLKSSCNHFASDNSQPPQHGVDNGTTLNNNDASKSRATTLCPNLTGRKSSINTEVNAAGDYSTLPQQPKAQQMGSPQATKYNTVPRSSSSAAGSRLTSDLHMYTSSPSRTPVCTPNPSPSLNRHSNAAQRPGAIDNGPLIAPSNAKVATLTNEGGRLQRDRMLARGRDFELVPEAVWKALSAWYGGSVPLPRTVIISQQGMAPELELYPIVVKLFRHQTAVNRPPQAATFTGMMGGIGGMPSTPRRYLAYTAAFSRKHTLRQILDFLALRLRFSREDMRLWKFKDEQSMTMLEEEESTLDQLGITENMQLLLEVRNKDLTWPEEMSFLAKNKAAIDRNQQAPTEKGASGLSNLGNTCFMNSAVQCVSNTRILTQYFTGGMHLYELNRSNTLGMKGHIAQRYGELIKDLWSGTAKSIAPLKLRWTIGKYAPRFNGFQQHDAQEFLAFLLDGLHEDLNRVHNKPYVELKDSDGREDEEVAKEAWDNHLLRNRSVIVDLFHGQLKSTVMCQNCGTKSVRFDPFTFLSLPLPMESCIHIEVIVIRLNGSKPVRYGLRLNLDEKYSGLKQSLSELSGIPALQLLIVEIQGALVKCFPKDHQKIRSLAGGNLHAYELPPTSPIPTMTLEEEAPLEPRGPPSRNSSFSSLTPSIIPNGSPNQSGASPDDILNGFVVAINRKVIRVDSYFLSSQKTRPSVFGVPVILPCDDHTLNLDLYKHVWSQVSRLVTPLPPNETSTSNHAQDCDDSLCYEYPFTLKVVSKDGSMCAWCPWYRFCRGCKLDCSEDMYNFGSSYIAIDWEPTALHLRYQQSQERNYMDHSSVEESRRLQTDPIDLDTCLKAFTTAEELGEDELVYCSKCKEHQRAIKTLKIWRLPPILIIHLKRFQFHNGRWVKSQKIVKFPVRKFDPANYVVTRGHSPVSPSSTSGIDDDSSENATGGTKSSEDEGIECRGQWGHSSTSMVDVFITEAKEDVVLSPADVDDRTDVEYDLYAMSVSTCDRVIDARFFSLSTLQSHSGIMGGGHYVTYAKHHNEKWYLYNDSSCKEIPETQVDTNNAYIMFFESRGLQYSHFMPDISDKNQDTQEIEDEFESDLKKMCTIC